MKSLIGSEELLNRHTGSFEPVELYDEIDAGHLDQFEKLWWPAIQARFKQFPSLEKAGEGNVQDAGWRWNELVPATPRLDLCTFSVECSGTLQGMMRVFTTRRSRLAGELDLVYIDRLASAPWNRRRFTENPKYKGVGELLMAAAVSLSVDRECKGRLALHSLPESESYYANIGMQDLGPDLKSEHLRYYEMTEQTATSFLSGRAL